jgi:acetyl-CoA synthetase
MNDRSVRFTHVIGTGNQSVLGPGDYIDALLFDDRVRAIGMYLEGIDSIDRFSRAAKRALEKGVPIVVLKVGKTQASAKQSSTHTSSLTGSDRLHDALFSRLGIIRVNSLIRMLETLKVLDLAGPLRGRNVLSLSCSGGEASIMADMADEYGLQMKPFSDVQMADLNAQFENYVTVSNPFDYNTSVWGDADAQQRCFTSALAGGHDAAFLIYDHPRANAEEVADEVNEWIVALDAFISAHKTTGMPAFVVSTVSELLPKDIRDYLAANGVVPLQGFEDGISAYSAAVAYHDFRRNQVNSKLLPRVFDNSSIADDQAVFLDEWDSKRLLSEYGLPLPASELVTATDAPAAANRLGFPVVVKAVGASFLHKSEQGAVKLRLHSPVEVAMAVEGISRSVAEKHGVVELFLVERMVSGAITELIIGIKRDEQFGPALVIGAGGTLVELFTDSVSLLLPTDRAAVGAALSSLTVFKLLNGYRGNPSGDVEAVIDAVIGIAAFAEDHWDTLLELDVNPLMVLPQGQGAVAADALIRLIPEQAGNERRVMR